MYFEENARPKKIYLQHTILNKNAKSAGVRNPPKINDAQIGFRECAKSPLKLYQIVSIPIFIVYNFHRATGRRLSRRL